HWSFDPLGRMIKESAQRIVEQRATSRSIHLLIGVFQPVEPEQPAREVGPGTLGVGFKLGWAPDAVLAQDLRYVLTEVRAFDTSGVDKEVLSLAPPLDLGQVS